MARKRPPRTSFDPVPGSTPRIVGQPNPGVMRPRVAARHISEGESIEVVGQPFRARFDGRCIICSGRVPAGSQIVKVQSRSGTAGHAHADCPGTTAEERRAAKAAKLLGLEPRPSAAPRTRRADDNSTLVDEPDPPVDEYEATSRPASSDSVDELLLDDPYSLVERIQSGATLDRSLEPIDYLALARAFIGFGDFEMASRTVSIQRGCSDDLAGEWAQVDTYVDLESFADLDSLEDARVERLHGRVRAREAERLAKIRAIRNEMDDRAAALASNPADAMQRASQARADGEHPLAAALFRRASALERRSLGECLVDETSGVRDRLDLGEVELPRSLRALRVISTSDDAKELRTWSRGAREDGRRREAVWCALRSLTLEWTSNAMLQVAAWLRSTKKSDRALSIATQAVEFADDDLACTIVQIAALTDLGNYRGALSLADAPGMRSRMYNRPFAWNAVGRAYALGGRLDDADHAFGAAWAAASARSDRAGELARASYLRGLLRAGDLGALRSDRT